MKAFLVASVAQRAVIARHPLLQRFGDHDRLLETERGEMIEQPQVLRTGAVIDLRQLYRAGRVALEQLAVMPLHGLEMAKQILGKGRPALIAEETRKPLHGLGIVRQRMGLLVGDHLQPVFDPPQKFVGRGEFVARLEA